MNRIAPPAWLADEPKVIGPEACSVCSGMGHIAVRIEPYMKFSWMKAFPPCSACFGSGAKRA